MILYNGKIFTMEGEPIEKGFVLIRDGKIADLGPMNRFPAGGGNETDEKIDLGGAGLYPGFVDAHCHIGMWEDGLAFEGDDGNEETDPFTPHLRGVDAVNPMDRCFEEALSAGVTSVVTGPGSANPMGGQLLAMKTMGRRIDDMLMRAPLAIKAALGENPKRVYSGKNQTPSTRMATAGILRDHLYKAKQYWEDKKKAETDPEADEVEFDIKYESLIPVFEQKLPVHFHVHRADDIFTAIRIAKEFGIQYRLVHCTEGYLIAEELGREQAGVLCGPLLCDRSKPELRNASLKNPGLLAKAGLQVAITTDHPVVPIQYLPLTAGLAVREGMDYEQALRAITIVPAQLCGIDDRVGSIRVGKDADLVAFDGNPLTMEAKPVLVVCGGNRAL